MMMWPVLIKPVSYTHLDVYKRQSFVFTPFITIGGMSGNWTSLLIAFVPRILLGYLAGLVYEQLQKKQRCV